MIIESVVIDPDDVEPDDIAIVRERRNGPLIAAAMALWSAPGDVVVDVTYGRGNWWTEARPEGLVAHDLYRGDGVDFRSLPEADCSVDIVMFDPPYVSKGGRETSGIGEMDDSYGLENAPKSPELLDQLIADGMREAHRVLKPGGRLMVKIMDYISSGVFHQGHRFVVNMADDIGFEQFDEFIHCSGKGPQPSTNLDGSPRRQVHSRRAHTFLVVLGKSGKPPNQPSLFEDEL